MVLEGQLAARLRFSEMRAQVQLGPSDYEMHSKEQASDFIAAEAHTPAHTLG